MTKKNKVSEILATIKKDEIKPIPKWQCQLSNRSFWLATVVAVILSSIFFSVILINLFEVPYEVFQYMKIGHYLKMLFSIFPFVWLFLVVASLILGLAAFHKTKYGYRYGFILLTSALLTVILMAGFVLHGFNVNKPLREFGENRIPSNLRNRPLDKVQNSIFVEEGLLGGEIINKITNKLFIEDLFEERWEVDFDDETKIQKGVELEIGDKIIVIGEKRGKFVFKAFVIKEIEGCRRCQMSSDFSR